MNMSQPEPQPDRVRRHTKPEVLEQIDRDIEKNVRLYATQPKEVISARLRELDQEWDIERTLQANASTPALTGAVLGLTVSRKALLLTCGVLGFLFQHAVSGWCPPVPFLRRMGFRTRGEIDREKFALKALRGDFKDLPERPVHKEEGSAHEVLQAVNA
jgi:hypothetical protein